MNPLYSKNHIRAALLKEPSANEEDIHWLVDASPEVQAHVRTFLPERLTAAAVLVPLVERATGLTVLLTQRAATLKDHAGQISFPGGGSSPRIRTRGPRRSVRPTKKLGWCRNWSNSQASCLTMR
jgi:hypothetical protein